jgi:sugar lactone lactonase YvrE
MKGMSRCLAVSAILALTTACRGGALPISETTDTMEATETDSHGTTETTTETGTMTTETGTSTSVTTIPAPPEFDCATAPPGPYKVRTLNGPICSEDLAFDDEGNVVGSDMQHIYKSTKAGVSTLVVPNLPFRAGLRLLSTGEIVLANDETGSLDRVDLDGTRTTVLSNLRYPNGLEVGPDDMVYLTEHDGRKVRRIDPFTGDNTVISDGDISSPNGISFNEDFTALYIAGFSGAKKIYKLPMNKDGTVAGELEVWADNVGTGWLDGIGVDVCGNVYIADYDRSQILRYDNEGNYIDTPIDMQGTWNYLPNMQWGSGMGDWNPNFAYFPEGWSASQMYELELGIPSKWSAYE